jgi:hypothetical protein
MMHNCWMMLRGSDNTIDAARMWLGCMSWRAVTQMRACPRVVTFAIDFYNVIFFAHSAALI